MWGQADAVADVSQAVGIIPTRVGTSQRLHYVGSGGQDHPHACGDKYTLTCRSAVNMGSSPRVWGQVASSKSYCLPFRIIPTRVGTSFSVNFVRSKIEDHPHACGDKFKIFCKLCACCGSSPRVWGQAQYKQCPRCKGRIIPTRVGTSATLYK